FRAVLNGNAHPRVEAGGALHPGSYSDRLKLRRRQAREPRISIHETSEAIGAIRNDGKPTAHIIFPIRRLIRAGHYPGKALRDRFNRRQRIIELMPDDANQPLPREALLFAERVTQIGNQHELMRLAALAKAAAMDFPPAHFPGERDLSDVRRFHREAKLDAEFLRGVADGAFGGPVEDAFSGPINQAQTVGRVERKHSDIDFLHHFAQEGRRFYGAEALLPQSFGERVYFAHDFAESIIMLRAARAYREVAFMQSGEHVGKRAQRKGNPVLRAERKAHPSHDDDDGQRPRGFCVMLAGPEKNDCSSGPDQARKERADEDAAFVRKRLHKPYFCSRRYSALRLRPSVLLAWLTFPPYRPIAF